MRCTTDNKKMHYIDGIFHIRRRAPTDLPPAPPPLIPPPLSLLGIICSFSQSTSFFGLFFSLFICAGSSIPGQIPQPFIHPASQNWHKTSLSRPDLPTCPIHLTFSPDLPTWPIHLTYHLTYPTDFLTWSTHLTYLPIWPTYLTFLPDLPTYTTYLPNWFTHLTYLPDQPTYTTYLTYPLAIQSR